MAPDVISWLRGRRREKIINLGDTIVRGHPGFVPSDFSNRETSSQTTRVVSGVSPKKKKEAADRIAPDTGSESFKDTKSAGRVLPDIAGESPVIEEVATKQMVPDISGESYMGEEKSAGPVLPGVAGESPVMEEVAAKQIVIDTKGKSLAGEGTPGQIGTKIDGVSLKARWDPSQESPKVASKSAKIPWDQEIHKEGHMDSTHYVARNEGESSIVRRLHPECNIIIPSDYHGAIEEIRACPLDCPYKVLEFAEIDQKALRNRPKPPK